MLQNLKNQRLVFILISYLLLVVGYSGNRVLFFHPTQLWLIFFGFIFLLLAFLWKKLIFKELKLEFESLLLVAVTISFIIFFLIDGGRYISNSAAIIVIIWLKFIALLFFLLYIFQIEMKGKNIFNWLMDHLVKYKFLYLVSLAIVMRLATIQYSPNPDIDVFWVLDDVADTLFEGRNPYSETWTFYNYVGKDFQIHEVVEHTSAAYLPLTIIASSFFKMIFGDIRTLFIFSSLLMSGIIYYLLAKKFEYSKKIAELVALLFLYSPLSLFILEQSWVDVFGLLFLSLFLLLLVLGKRSLAFVIFGLMLAVKQTMFIFAFFLLRSKGFTLKRLLQIIISFAVIVVPFLMWNPRDFIDDVFFHHLSFVEPNWAMSFSNVLRLDSLGIITPIVAIIILGGLAGFLWLKNPRDLLGFMYASVIVLFAVFMFKRGFLNYYHLVSSSMILTLVLELGKIKDKLPELKSD